MGGMGFQLGSLMILRASFMPRRSAGMPVLKHLVNGGQANEFLAEGRGVAQTEQHWVVVAVDLHVACQITAVAHDVVAVGVARGVELALAGDVPVGDARARLSTTSATTAAGKCWLAT